jgi:23S rRNA pseudouridine1911/1915/1917 synthase
MGANEPSPGIHTFFVEADREVRLDVFLAQRLGISRTQAATLIAEGRVVLDGRREKAGYRPRVGEQVIVEIPPPPKRTVLPEQIPLSVVFEDEHVLVVDKPAGMVVHPAPGHWSGTLVNALKGRAAGPGVGGSPAGSGGATVGPEAVERGKGGGGGGGGHPDELDRAGIVHRLDKDTSGLLLVAKTDLAHRALGAALAARRIVRRYAALIWGHLDADRVTVDRPIGRDPRDRKRMAIVSSGRAARTDFVRLARFDSVDLVRAHLHTGRTHQIRVHLASIGHPVVGDDTYGGGGGRRLLALAPKRQFLHAAWLIFPHPVSGALVDLRSPLPPDLRGSLAAASGLDDLPSHPDPLDELGFYRLDH